MKTGCGMDSNSLQDRISSIRKRISTAALRTGRKPHDITLISVTKTVHIEAIKEAVAAGLSIFGENRVQEAQGKIAACDSFFAGHRLHWHFIGHLQKNKAKYAVQLFDLIHSLDSITCAEELNRHAGKAGKIQEVLVEVKLSKEESKHGVLKEDLIALLSIAANLKNLKIKGLMTIPPFFVNIEEVRPYFMELRELKDKAVSAGFEMTELSMGMSHDFEIAIEEGATMVRVGSAIFGERG